MAGNHQLNEKMAVYNSVDQSTEDRGKKEVTREDMELNIPRATLKMKSVDPVSKKKSFEITGVVMAPQVPIDHGNEECDSLDDVDETCETHTEEVSSDILDSKNTDIDPDPSSIEDVSPNLEEPPRDPNRNISDMTSRFKVVKIETREPFKRGRWTCLDFLDSPAEKLDKGVEEAGSGNSSAASSIHYIPGTDDPAKNPFAANIVYAEGHTIHEPQPVLPSLSSQQGVNVLQNGDYTPSSMVMTSTSGVITIPESSTTSKSSQGTVPPDPSATGAPPQSQPASLAKPLSSQTQPILTPSQPTSLPATLLNPQQPGKDYVPNAFPVADSSQPSTSKTTNGHIPAQVKSTQNVGVEPIVPISLIPGVNNVNVSQTSSTNEIQNPSVDYVVTQGQDYLQPSTQDYLPPGQEYVNLGSQSQDFLPPPSSSTEFTQTTATAESGVVTQPEAPQPASVISQVQQPPKQNVQQQQQQAEFAGGTSHSQNHSTASAVPQSIAPSSTSQVGDYSINQATSVPAIVTKPTGSTKASSSNENVQNAEQLAVAASEKVPFQVVAAGDEPQQTQTSGQNVVVDPLPVDNEEESKGVSASPSEKPPITPQSILAPPLLEMVATINAVGMDPTKSDGGESGASTVAIDNKIEQAMDLVKSHLMYAVREEVEVLKEQIKELLEKNSQLEYENSILKAAATPDTMTELQQRTQQQQQKQQQQQQQQQQTQPPPSSSS